jgi:hypothetical protein
MAAGAVVPAVQALAFVDGEGVVVVHADVLLGQLDHATQRQPWLVPALAHGRLAAGGVLDFRAEVALLAFAAGEHGRGRQQEDKRRFHGAFSGSSGTP